MWSGVIVGARWAGLVSASVLEDLAFNPVFSELDERHLHARATAS